MAQTRKESDSLGVVEVPADKLWGAQTQRSLEYFSIGRDLIPPEMITAYAILKKAAAAANHANKRLDDRRYKLIAQACDEILAGKHHDMFPLHVWMTGSGTQFNMNVNEVISNRCSQLAGTPLGSKTPVHPNDDVNMAQSSNDTFPSAMYIAAALNVKQCLIPAVTALRDAIGAKAQAWDDIVKIGRTHMQDATPLTLGQEWSGYAGMLSDDLERIEAALQGVWKIVEFEGPDGKKDDAVGATLEFDKDGKNLTFTKGSETGPSPSNSAATPTSLSPSRRPTARSPGRPAGDGSSGRWESPGQAALPISV